MISFDWDWWDSLTPEDRERREKKREYEANYKLNRELKTKEKNNNG